MNRWLSRTRRFNSKKLSVVLTTVYTNTHMHVLVQTYTPHAAGGHKEKRHGLVGKDKA